MFLVFVISFVFVKKNIEKDFVSFHFNIFCKGVNAGNISFAIVDDIIPELDESYTCSLTKVNNNAELDNHTEISITIVANDEPFGVFEVNSESREIVAGESDVKSANNTIRIGSVILYTFIRVIVLSAKRTILPCHELYIFLFSSFVIFWWRFMLYARSFLEIEICVQKVIWESWQKQLFLDLLQCALISNKGHENKNQNVNVLLNSSSMFNMIYMNRIF